MPRRAPAFLASGSTSVPAWLCALFVAALAFASGALTAAPALPDAPAFPLRKSANGRYLVDRNGEPFLIKMTCAWGLIVRLAEEDVPGFYDDIKAKGFNTVLVRLICKHQYVQSGDPTWTDPSGKAISPFLVEWDFSQPNEVYFAHADRVIRMAEEKGILVMLVSNYLGSGGGDPKRQTGAQGWWDELLSANNSVEKSRAYGRYLGQRYRNFPNLVWVAGGDHNGLDGEVIGDGAIKPHQLAIIQGVKEHDDHLWTGHFKPKPVYLFSRDNPVYKDYMDLDGLYSTREASLGARGPFYKADLAQYAKGNLIFHLDQAYEMDFQTPDTTNYQWIRRKNYDALLSGCAGTIFTPGSDTMQNGGLLTQFNANWRELIGHPASPEGGTKGMQEAKHCFNLFTPRAWHELVPDVSSALVTAGRGKFGDIDYVCAALTASGRLAIIYVPTARSITVAMARLAGPTVRVFWYDPTTGASVPVSTALPAGTGAPEKIFTTPTALHAGDGSSDWVLVLEADPPSSPPASNRRNSDTR